MRRRIFTRGGARNHIWRTSHRLTLTAAQRIWLAATYAPEIGLPFNRMITIHWERAGVKPSKGAEATAKFLKSAGDYLRGRGKPFAYVWVRENDYGDGRKGDHVHILCHVPKGESFKQRQLAWIKSYTGRTYRGGVIHGRRIGGTANAAESAPEHYRANLAEAIGYVLKDASTGLKSAPWPIRWDGGGTVIGKRSSISNNLSRAVRDGTIG